MRLASLTNCDTLQHTATHCNTLQHTAACISHAYLSHGDKKDAACAQEYRRRYSSQNDADFLMHETTGDQKEGYSSLY